MRAVRIHQFGGPEVLQVDEIPTPTPGPGQVLVRLRAVGVNFIDTYHRTGLYRISLPFIPGQEGAGEVAAVGPGVTEFREGDRVAYAGVSGSYAEYNVVPADRLVKLPPPSISRRRRRSSSRASPRNSSPSAPIPSSPGRPVSSTRRPEAWGRCWCRWPSEGAPG